MYMKNTEIDNMSQRFSTKGSKKSLHSETDIKIIDAFYSCCNRKKISENYKNYSCFKISYFMDIFKYL